MERATTKLQDLLTLWHDKRNGRLIPSRADMPVATLRPWLGNLALIDLTGVTPYFRLCGTGLHARFGGEMTNRKLDAVDAAHGQDELLACIEKARNTLNPSPMVHEFSADHNRTVYHELCLPLGHDGKTADTMLLASYVEQKR